MKYPSLDNAEGIAVLVGLGAAVYVVYQIVKAGKAIPTAIADTIGGAVNAVESAGAAIASAVPTQANVEQAQANMAETGDSGIDGTQLWPLPSTGTDSRIGSGSQNYSPSAVNDMSDANLTLLSNQANAIDNLDTMPVDAGNGKDW